MQIALVSLFPEMFEAVSEFGVTGRAVKQGLVQISHSPTRSHSTSHAKTMRRSLIQLPLRVPSNQMLWVLVINLILVWWKHLKASLLENRRENHVRRAKNQ